LAETLDLATEKFLTNKKSPSRKVNELDNRGSHFYLTMYWAEALASQDKNDTLKQIFTPIAEQLTNNETTIVSELNNAQGSTVELSGYYFPNEEKIAKAMKPSATLNSILASI